MRAKFICESIVKNVYAETTTLNAVYGGATNKEDNEFSEATPSGKIEIMVTNKSAHGFLVPGKKYYVDFTEAAE